MGPKHGQRFLAEASMMSILFHPLGRSVQNEGSEIPRIGLLSPLSNPAFTETSRFVAEFFPRSTPPCKMQYQTARHLNALHGPRRLTRFFLTHFAMVCHP